jgi:hypothetical protein
MPRQPRAAAAQQAGPATPPPLGLTCDMQVIALALERGMGHLLYHKLKVRRRLAWLLVALARERDARALA